MVSNSHFKQAYAKDINVHLLVHNEHNILIKSCNHSKSLFGAVSEAVVHSQLHNVFDHITVNILLH